ncbi:preprotein translocase subunit SecA, partial [Candidatus Saccharibacteria bacterium]|nr:preprotein translocase subunit SecA [Candidatus Saccharibacteria bacterium]
RQGDPGVTQFYVSTEDDLMRIFQGDRVAGLMDRLGVDEDMPIQNRAVSKTLEAAQKRVEGYNYDTRKNVVQYDNVINRHRKVVYIIRREILKGEDIKPEIDKLIADSVAELTDLPAKNNPNFAANFEVVYPISDKEILKIGAEKNDKARRALALAAVNKLYAKKEKEIGSENMRSVEREVYLQVLDTLWMQHLENMQHLREGIHWRSVGQRDPLVEYRAESQKLFDSLQATLRAEVLKAITHVTKGDIAHREFHETELTRAAEGAVEVGVNEITSGEKEINFSVQSDGNKKKSVARKKKKQKRQNRKKNR